jgi:glycosyltransferase involved in cell wall biosynthesis
VVHTDHARSFPDKVRYMVAEHVLSYFTFKMVGVSEHTTANLIRYEKIPRRKLVTILNGIEGGAYHGPPIDLAAKRRELGLPATGPVIGTIARFTDQKGITYLIEAMPELLRAHPTLSLVVAGEGELAPEYHRRAAELGVTGQVHIVGVRTDVADLLQLFSAFVLPSVWEGLPMVILEALAAGCPIVASGVGGVPSAIQHEVNGSLVEPRQPAQLARQIGRLLSDDELRERYRVEGRRVFQARYSAEAMTRQYEKLYLRQELDG